MDLSNIRGSKRKADDMTEKVFILPRDSVAGIMEHLQQTVGQKLTDHGFVYECLGHDGGSGDFLFHHRGHYQSFRDD